MKYWITILLTAVAMNASAQLTDTVEWEKLVQFESERKGPHLSAPKNLNTLHYDVKYHRMEWEVSPLVRYIGGAVTTYFVPQTTGFNQIYFDLHTAMAVSAVQYHGTSCTFSQLPSSELLVTLPATLPVGVLDSLTISYGGVPPTTGFGSYATQNVCSNTVPAMWTLSEPYGARDWWPCKQDLNDKADSIDIYITTPSAYKGVANGVLMSQTVSGANTIYHWRHRHPIPAYLVAIAVSDYSVHSATLSLSGGGSIPMVNYLYPCSGTSGTTINNNLQPIMQLFVNLFGNYPFTNEKYGHAQFGWGGGMEHTTVSFMGGFSHLLLAHELAHQWFGDKITCGSWADIWLNEGFATYLEGMTYENGLGGGASVWASWKQSKINNVTSSASGSVWVDDTTSVSRIFSSRLSYDKGALLLHMLRWKLGDTNFFQGVRNYLNDPALAYGYAKTPQLKAHLEAVSGQNLDEFFADWYYGQGYPTYTVQWSQNGAQLLTVQLFQTPSHASVSFFNIPVPVRFNGASKNRTLVFDPSTNGQTFTEQLDFTVTSVEFDPDRWLCAKSSIVLPVELTELSASWDGKAVQVKWATATETDNRGFEIQRMSEYGAPANNWETIGWKDGQGTSQTPAYYQWPDERPMQGMNYYRLRQLDFDGSEEFSMVVSVEARLPTRQVPGAGRGLKLFPNPTRQEVWVEWPAAVENAELELYDVHGRLLLRQRWQEPLQRRQLLLGELPGGVYAVVLRAGGQVWMERLVRR
jgi:hypothetical protein